jgi:hypothetical protein
MFRHSGKYHVYKCTIIKGAIMRAWALFLCLLPAMIFAQQYYEASGQTQVFTLTAGAKAGSTAILPHGRLTPSSAPHMLVTMQNGVHISIAGIQGNGRVSIYNLSGKRVQTAEITGKSSVALRSDLSGGVYFARLEVNGRLVQTTRFWKAR